MENNSEELKKTTSNEDVVETTNVQEEQSVVSENIKEETVGYNNVPTEDMIKKNNKKIFVIAALLVVVLVGLYFAYTKMFNNPKNIFLKSINNGYKEIENSFSSLTNNKVYSLTEKGKYLVDENVKFDLDIDDSLIDSDMKDLIDDLNDLELSYKAGVDTKNKEMLFNIAALSDKENVLSLGMYATKEKMYLELKDLLDKYIEMPIEDYDSLFESSDAQLDELNYLVTEIKDTTLDNLKEKDFKTSKTRITIDSKKVDVKKISYELDEKKFTILLKDVMTDLKSNDKFIKEIAELSATDKKEIKSGLQEAIDSLDESIKEADFDTETVIAFNVYTKGVLNKTLKYEIAIQDDEDNMGISYSKNGKVSEFDITSTGIPVVKAKMTKESKNKSKTVMTIASAMKLTIDTTKKDDDVTSKFDLSIIGMDDFSATGTMTTKLDEVKKNKEYDETIRLDLKVEYRGTEMFTLKADGEGTIKVVDKLDIPNLSNSVKYSKLTEEDQTTITNNLMKNEKLMSLIEKISEISEGSTKNNLYDYE